MPCNDKIKFRPLDILHTQCVHCATGERNAERMQIKIMFWSFSVLSRSLGRRVQQSFRAPPHRDNTKTARTEKCLWSSLLRHLTTALQHQEHREQEGGASEWKASLDRTQLLLLMSNVNTLSIFIRDTVKCRLGNVSYKPLTKVL